MVAVDLNNVDPAFPVNWACRLNRGLVAWWIGLPRLAGAARWRDLVRRNHGTLTNMNPAADWKSSERGRYALDFDGSDDYVTLPDYLIRTKTVGATAYSAWIKTTSAARQVIVGGNEFSYAYPFGGLLVGNVSQKASFCLGFNGTSYIFVDGASNVTDGKWHHVAGYCDAGGVHLFVDGILEGSRTDNNAGSMVVDPHYFRIGALRKGASHVDVMQGLIDDVRVWNRALSAAEVLRLHQDSLRGYPATLRRRVAALGRAVTATPYRTVAGHVWHAGAAIGQHSMTGQQAGQACISGPLAGQIHG